MTSWIICSFTSFTNTLNISGKGVCNGDAGSGLVYKHPNSSRYYIHGIVSLTPVSENTCDIMQNTFYTKVSFAYDFITQQMNKFYEEDCKLPAPPKNGEWMLVTGENREKGDIVSWNDILTVNCIDRFALDSLMDVTTCKKSFKISDCHGKNKFNVYIFLIYLYLYFHQSIVVLKTKKVTESKKEKKFN